MSSEKNHKTHFTADAFFSIKIPSVHSGTRVVITFQVAHVRIFVRWKTCVASFWADDTVPARRDSRRGMTNEGRALWTPKTFSVHKFYSVNHTYTYCVYVYTHTHAWNSKRTCRINIIVMYVHRTHTRSLLFALEFRNTILFDHDFSSGFIEYSR